MLAQCFLAILNLNVSTMAPTNLHFNPAYGFGIMRGSRNLFQGQSRPDGQKTVWTCSKFFCFVYWLFSPQLILQFTEGVEGFMTEKTILFQGSRGGPTFPLVGGGGGGANANFYRIPYNL